MMQSSEDKNKSRKDLTNVQNTSIIENNGTPKKKVGRPKILKKEKLNKVEKNKEIKPHKIIWIVGQ